MTPQDVWNAAYNQLELQLDRASFDTWLREATFLRVENDDYVIGVPHSYAQEMLQNRLYRNVWRILSDIRGQDTQLRFVIHKATPPQPETNLFGSVDDAPLFRFMQQRNQQPDLPENSRFFSQATSTQYDLSNPSLPTENDLNPRYSFDRFVVNHSNQVVYEAALAVADYPATVYNPFFIYGGVGLGKTHLLQSIASICQRKGLRTLYIPSEVFTNDLVTSIRNRTTAMFRDKYRAVDVLLVDDVQFISGKETTQEEFFHTFNALVNFNKQIVLASDRHPSQMKTLEDRLRSRFQGGLVADIQPPEYETRVAILQMWANERGVTIPREVIEAVAERGTQNVRELEGMFNQILAQTRLNNGKVSLPRAETTLERYHQPRERVTLERIIEVAAQKHGMEYADLIGKRRTARINRARQIAMYLSRDMTEFSLPQIGKAFGGRSHTTVLHGANKIADELEIDKVLEARLAKLRQTIAKRK